MNLTQQILNGTVNFTSNTMPMIMNHSEQCLIKMAKEGGYQLDFLCLQEKGIALIQESVVRLTWAVLMIMIITNLAHRFLKKYFDDESKIDDHYILYSFYMYGLDIVIYGSMGVLCLYILFLRYGIFL